MLLVFAFVGIFQIQINDMSSTTNCSGVFCENENDSFKTCKMLNVFRVYFNSKQTYTGLIVKQNLNCYNIRKQLDFNMIFNTFTRLHCIEVLIYYTTLNAPSYGSQYEFTNSPWHAHEATLLPHATGTFPLRKHVGYFLQITYASWPLLCLCKSPHM